MLLLKRLTKESKTNNEQTVTNQNYAETEFCSNIPNEEKEGHIEKKG